MSPDHPPLVSVRIPDLDPPCTRLAGLQEIPQVRSRLAAGGWPGGIAVVRRSKG
jgi:hypothetical protein